MHEQTEAYIFQETTNLNDVINVLKNEPLDIQIQLLEKRTKNLRDKENSQQTNFVDDLREEVQDFKYLVGEESEAYLNKIWKDPHFSVYMRFLNLYVDKGSDNFWGVRFEQGIIDFEVLKKFESEVSIEPIVVLINTLRHAANRYLSIRSDLREHLKKDYHPFSFPIELSKQHNFSSPYWGGDLIGIGVKYLYKLLEPIVANDIERYHTALYSVESQYFHELIHTLNNDEDSLDYGGGEEMTMLGEFLYNPLHNQDGNEMFSQMSKFVLNEEKTKEEGKWDNIYDGAFKDVVLKILLYELFEKDIIQPPLNRQSLEVILPNLHLYYSLFTENERNELFKKYVVMEKKELYDLMEDYTEKLGLIF